MIEQELYNKILENMPIVCVDGVIKYANKILYLKRKNEPEANKWWLPGGRILKGETLEDGVKRKIKEETGLSTEIVKLIGITQTQFDTGPNKIPVHTINVTFSLRPTGQDEVKIDSNHSEFMWSKKVPIDIHPEIKRIVST